MQTNKILILSVLLCLITACKKNIETQNVTTPDTSKIKKAEAISTHVDDSVKIQNKSFVVSCGTSCAMTYTAEKITKEGSTFNVVFNVDNYINEELSDSYKEKYSFIYDTSNNIDKIISEDNNQNVLETLPNGAKESFIEFSKLLLEPAINQIDSNFKFSNSILPYQKKLDINKVTYKSMPTKDIKGLSEFSCGEKEVRYLLLDKVDKIRLLLIPMDCGDFTYRYYLVSIHDNSVISDLYVEGESFEPDGDNISEKTSFTINETSILTVTSINKDFQKGIIESKKYFINNKGKIIETKK